MIEIRENRAQFIFVLLSLLSGSLLFIYVNFFVDRRLVFQYLNELNRPWADAIFPTITFLAEWPGWTFVAVLGAFFAMKHFFINGLLLTINGLIVQFLKRQVFSDIRRPISFFAPEELNLVEGIEMHQFFSFPSGHTTAAFTIGFLICRFIPKKRSWFALVIFLLAALMGFSRIYLSLHWPRDVAAAAVVSMLLSLFIYPRLLSFSEKIQLNWWHLPITKLIKPN